MSKRYDDFYENTPYYDHDYPDDVTTFDDDPEVEDADNNAEWQAQRAAEKAAAKPAPKGRVKIEGTVVKTETKETEWGMRDVMLVKTTEGWLCWGSVPRNATVEKDCRIVFVATVEPSEKDDKFAFFTRPVLYMTKEEKAALKAAEKENACI